IDRYFREVVRHKASNLHVKVGKPPTLRVNGRLRALGDTPLTEEDVVRLCAPMLDERHSAMYQQDGGTDFAYLVRCDDVVWRFRVNLFQQMGTMAMVAQTVEPHIPNLEELNLPPQLERLCEFDQGMILVAGM